MGHRRAGAKACRYRESSCASPSSSQSSAPSASTSQLGGLWITSLSGRSRKTQGMSADSEPSAAALAPRVRPPGTSAAGPAGPSGSGGGARPARGVSMERPRLNTSLDSIACSSSRCTESDRETAHIVPLRCLGSKTAIFATASFATAAKKPSSLIVRDANAHEVFDRCCGSKWISFATVSADTARKSAGTSKPSVANDHARFDMFCEVNSGNFVIASSVMKWKSSESSTPSVANAQARIAKF
mmetsp:Transcript_97544/g.291329  ORF Transcript_97544/g.291329 Transcript_97544/m.291329 type:complete len:243 (-) Transcript_97544:720-1448(-)